MPLRFALHLLALWFCVSLAGVSPALDAQEKGDRERLAKPAIDRKPSDKRPGKSLPHETPGHKGRGITPAREAAALAFVREHHAELETLLASLKEKQPKQYEAAIRDLFRHSERLAGIQEGDASRYELELKSWKLQSRVQLLSATVLMSPSDEAARQKLRQAIVEQLRVRREMLVLERARQAKRLQKIDEQLATFDRELETSADRQLKAILAGSPPKAKAMLKTSATNGKGGVQ